MAASHRQSMGAYQSLSEINHLKCSSLQQLRIALTQPPKQFSKEAAIASMLTLCMAGIVSGGTHDDSWKVHLNGVVSLGFPDDVGDSPINQHSETTTFLKHWYMSIFAIAQSCGHRRVYSCQQLLDSHDELESHYIDELTGFSTWLLPVFGEISHLRSWNSNEKRSLQLDQTNTAQDPNVEIAVETCQILIDGVRRMLAIRKPAFRPRVAKLLTPSFRADLFALDEAYHHMALLQLYCRVPWNICPDSVQKSVTQILTCFRTISFSGRPCPAVAALPPLFIAGCQARRDSDREMVTALLNQQVILYGMGNVRSARNVLSRLWSCSTAADYESGLLHWEDLIGKRTNNANLCI